jgi:chemosensory pili system protein ChpC
MKHNLMTETPLELATLLIPLQNKQLLLPNVSLAEIVNYSELAEIKRSPEWVLGLLSWRKHNVPVVSFEVLNNEPFSFSMGDGRIAVLNAINDSEKLPFLGVLIKDIPRLSRVAAEELATDLTAKPGMVEQLIVTVNGEKASIPDLENIEKQLLGTIEL